MEKAIIALFALMGLSFISMAVAIVFDKSRLIDFDKSRLIDFFCLACMALGGVTLVLSFVNLLLIV
jgi:hypothetical protein|nr:MAG TPA: hypothetical protein [Caudoviricetes sp.]